MNTLWSCLSHVYILPGVHWRNFDDIQTLFFLFWVSIFSNESVDENANAALAMVGKVVSLLQRAQARNKLASALEFLRQRVGLNLPSLGGEMLTQEALDEAEKQMSTEADWTFWFETAEGCSYFFLGVGRLMSLAGFFGHLSVAWKNHIQERFFELRFSLSYFVLAIFWLAVHCVDTFFLHFTRPCARA